jgi:hypothetical protein
MITVFPVLKLPVKSMASVLPYHGSIHTNGTFFDLHDHRPNTGVSNLTVTKGFSFLTRLTVPT